jgi:hypothetical protein
MYYEGSYGRLVESPVYREGDSSSRHFVREGAPATPCSAPLWRHRPVRPRKPRRPKTPMNVHLDTIGPASYLYGLPNPAHGGKSLQSTNKDRS